MLPIIVGKWSFPAVWLLSIRQCRPWTLYLHCGFSENSISWYFHEKLTTPWQRSIWEQILRKPACTRSFPFSFSNYQRSSTDTRRNNAKPFPDIVCTWMGFPSNSAHVVAMMLDLHRRHCLLTPSLFFPLKSFYRRHYTVDQNSTKVLWRFCMMPALLGEVLAFFSELLTQPSIRS